MFSNSWQVGVRVGSVVSLVAAAFFMIGCGGSSSSNGPSLGPGTNNNALHGQYAFSFAGQNGTTGTMMAVGSFTADGNGNITGGMEDFNAGRGGLSFTFTGKYSVGSDLRGTAILTGLQVCPNWQFVMLNTSHAFMTCFDSANTASGSIDIQDTSAFTNAKVTGNYVFGISGPGVRGGLSVVAGDLTMDGAGNITGGEMDVNDSLTTAQDAAATGTYAVGSNGRGTLSLNGAYGTQNFVFYVVNATDLKMVETDVFGSLPLTSGEVLRQAASPFNLASLNGNYVFTLGGTDSLGVAAATGGVLTADGNGGLTGVLDDNDGGNVNFGSAFNGTYSMGTFGRALLSFSFLQLAAYPAANGTIQLVELDGSGTSAGIAKIQTGGPFTPASTNGSFALNWSGTLNPNSISISPSEEDITGQLTPDGIGGLGGTLDVNSFGNNVIQGLALGGSSYTMTTNGRGTASVNTSAASFNMQTYQADPNTVLFLDVDTTRVLVGLMQKQQ